MNKYLIVVVVSVLALLVGCTSELDRCIEANIKKYEGEFSKGIAFFEGESHLSREDADMLIKSQKKVFEEEIKKERKEARKKATKLCNLQGIY